ncbi:hypothetical protein CR970_00200 [Candidatus Saccharibacteria bacterium]|nr:MAG: hypothetical protein CR970_00200 [Candidatus Saccharibacteria bacterium]
MSTDISTKNIKQSVRPIVNFGRTYLPFAFFVAFGILCMFLVYQINSYASVEPTEDEIAEQLKVIQRPHIDDELVVKIQQLQDQNIEVRTLFEQARNNPFSE